MTVIVAPPEEIEIGQATERLVYYTREHFVSGSQTLSGLWFHGAKIIPAGTPLPFEMGPPPDLGQPFLTPPFLEGLVYWTGWWMGDPPWPNDEPSFPFPLWFTTEGKLQLVDEVTPETLCESWYTTSLRYGDPMAFLEFVVEGHFYHSGLSGMTEVPRDFWFGLRDIGFQWRDDAFSLPPAPCPL